MLRSDPTLAECLRWTLPTFPALDDRWERNNRQPVLFRADCGREFVDWELDEDADDAFASSGRGSGVSGLEELALVAAALLTLFAVLRWSERDRLGGTRARRSILTTVVVRKESDACRSM